jgi:hypothetical protein
MKYVDDLKNASAAEFDEAEADWRETVQRMFEGVAECEHVPTPEELDNLDFDPDLDLDHAIGAIKTMSLESSGPHTTGLPTPRSGARSPRPESRRRGKPKRRNSRRRSERHAPA